MSSSRVPCHLFNVLFIIPLEIFFDYTLRSASLHYCQSTASNFDLYSAHLYGHSLACHTYCHSEPVTFTPIAKRLAMDRLTGLARGFEQQPSAIEANALPLNHHDDPLGLEWTFAFLHFIGIRYVLISIIKSLAIRYQHLFSWN